MRIFISYAREDFEHAKKLFDDLSAIEEVNSWLDQESLLPGMDWEEAILSAIKESRFIILLLSSKSIDKTGFVQKELKAALERFTRFLHGALFLIPVRLDACQPRDRELNRFQWVDMFPEWERGIELIVKVIKEGMERHLASLFDVYDKNKYLKEFSKDDWVSQNQGYLSQFRASTIIDFLEKRYTKYVEELDALGLMIQLSVRAGSDSLVLFVIRTHEVAKRLKYFYEWPSAYGVVFSGGKLLPDYVRTMFFKTIYDNNMKFIKSKFLPYPDTSWFDELLLRDAAKHYMMQSRGRDFSDREVTCEALKLMTWDVPYFDLAIFYSLRAKRFANLLPLVTILRRGNSKTRDPIEWNLPEYDPDQYGDHSDLPEFNEEKAHYADERESLTRIGALLRIGEYLVLSDSEKHKTYGYMLRDIALELLARSGVADLVRGLTPESRMTLFSHIERQDWRAIQRFVPDKSALKTVGNLVKPFSVVWDAELEEFVPVCLEGEVIAGDING